jgi:hypothetical protein
VKKLLTIAALTASTFTAQAELRINGFANFVGGITSSDDTVYGYDDKFSSTSESLFAIQISGDINDKTTATGQLIARGENDYEPVFEWAYLTYQATDKTSISAGRFRLPLFRYSASKDVGYSHHWITPPRSVYDIAFNNVDGIRIDYADYAGDWEYNLQASFGGYDSELGGGQLSGRDVVVLSAEAQYDWFKARFVTGRAKTDFTLPALEETFAGIAAVSPALASRLEIAGDSGEFFGIGLEIDKFDWFVSAEITTVETKASFAGKDEAFYVTAGMRMGAFTPSITIEALDGTVNGIQNTDITSTFPAELAVLVGTNEAIQKSFMDKTSRISVGIRYDLDTNMALKADISRVTDHQDDIAALGALTASQAQEIDVTLLRFAVNYVF